MQGKRPQLLPLLPVRSARVSRPRRPPDRRSPLSALAHGADLLALPLPSRRAPSVSSGSRNLPVLAAVPKHPPAASSPAGVRRRRRTRAVDPAADPPGHLPQAPGLRRQQRQAARRRGALLLIL